MPNDLSFGYDLLAYALTQEQDSETVSCDNERKQGNA